MEQDDEVLISFADTETRPDHIAVCATRMQQRQVEGIAALTFGMEEQLASAQLDVQDRGCGLRRVGLGFGPLRLGKRYVGNHASRRIARDGRVVAHSGQALVSIRSTGGPVGSSVSDWLNVMPADAV